ncbi:hypothetical protein [Shinella sp. NM-101]|uniref:hypothetical protein n=1 Tax=Shinella sp. NM-101 TaxID=2744455 RepID=UPI001F1A1DFF|nr:hypothetical protein [Shinella sp. NM-101]
MFDLAELVAALPPSNQPLRQAVRRLHWFRAAFEATARHCGETMGCTFAVDEHRLAGIFVRWLKSIEAQKPGARSEREEFFDFVPSLVLRELIADMPLKALCPPDNVDGNPPAEFWPEGYVCTMFCLAVHAKALDEEFHTRREIDRMVDDLRSWYSFKENAAEDTAFAAGFFQKLLGHEPNWTMPATFRARNRAPQ